MNNMRTGGIPTYRKYCIHIWTNLLCPIGRTQETGEIRTDLYNHRHGFREKKRMDGILRYKWAALNRSRVVSVRENAYCKTVTDRPSQGFLDVSVDVWYSVEYGDRSTSFLQDSKSYLLGIMTDRSRIDHIRLRQGYHMLHVKDSTNWSLLGSHAGCTLRAMFAVMANRLSSCPLRFAAAERLTSTCSKI